MTVEINPIDVEIDGRAMKDAQVLVDDVEVAADELINMIYGDTPDIPGAIAKAQAVLEASWGVAPVAVTEELRSQMKSAADEIAQMIRMLTTVNERVAIVQRLAAPYGGSVMLTSLAIAGDATPMAGFLEQSPKRLGLIYRALRSALKKLREGIVNEMTVDTIDAINAACADKKVR